MGTLAVKKNHNAWCSFDSFRTGVLWASNNHKEYNTDARSFCISLTVQFLAGCCDECGLWLTPSLVGGKDIFGKGNQHGHVRVYNETVYPKHHYGLP